LGRRPSGSRRRVRQERTDLRDARIKATRDLLRVLFGLGVVKRSNEAISNHATLSMGALVISFKIREYVERMSYVR
jgi:hypothetical protein